MTHVPCAAPERSTELCSVMSVCINHGTSSSKPLSPIPRTIVPRARADAVRTSGTGSSRDCFRPGIIVGRYGDRSYIISIIIIIIIMLLNRQPQFNLRYDTKYSSKYHRYSFNSHLFDNKTIDSDTKHDSLALELARHIC